MLFGFVVAVGTDQRRVDLVVNINGFFSIDIENRIAFSVDFTEVTARTVQHCGRIVAPAGQGEQVVIHRDRTVTVEVGGLAVSQSQILVKYQGFLPVHLRKDTPCRCRQTISC